MSQTFRSRFEDNGPGILVEVQPDVVEALHGGKRPAVRIVVNGVELRTHVAVYGGKSYLGFRKEIREQAHIEPGDDLEIFIELDTAERTVDVPAELLAIFEQDPEAQAAFDGLSFTNRKEY